MKPPVGPTLMTPRALFGQSHTRKPTGHPIRLATLLTTAFLTACAGLGVQKTPEEQVTSRAQARLDALLESDFKKAYKYTSPAYRESYGINNYTRRYAGASSWNKAEVSNVTCEEYRCDVSLRVSYQTFKAGFENTRSMQERWIKVDGDWFLYLK